jgi:uncharacterized membrane protein (DUF2068 family)
LLTFAGMGSSRPRRERVVLAIGVFKLVKATLLVGLGIASLVGLTEDLAERIAHALKWSGAFPGRATMRHLFARLLSLDERTLREVGIAALGYAAVFTVEGVGLLSKKHWAEWVVVGVTASFIPLEIYELQHRFGAGKLVALALNVAIAIYLAWDRLHAAPASVTPPASRPA